MTCPNGREKCRRSWKLTAHYSGVAGTYVRAFWRYPIFGRLEFCLWALPPNRKSDYSFRTVAVRLGLHNLTAHPHNTLLRLCLGDQRCVYVFVLRKRAVAQLLEPVCRELSLQAQHLQPQWQDLFHARTRFQSFMSSPLRQTEDTKNFQSKIFLSY